MTATTEGVAVRVHVQPKASKSEIKGLHGDRVKVRVAAKPAEGEANRAVCELLAKMAGVARSQVELLRGTTSRDKDLLIRCDKAKEVETRLRGLLPSS
ncbi:YggU family protein [Candidatus Sumerlaeota bacterium]|nr:YggU family protein [Candidatus Sumerlaeota bacterium]